MAERLEQSSVQCSMSMFHVQMFHVHVPCPNSHINMIPLPYIPSLGLRIRFPSARPGPPGSGRRSRSSPKRTLKLPNALHRVPPEKHHKNSTEKLPKRPPKWSKMEPKNNQKRFQKPTLTIYEKSVEFGAPRPPSKPRKCSSRLCETANSTKSS